MKDTYRPTIRTNEPSDQRTFGTMNLRNNGPSEQKTFGTPGSPLLNRGYLPSNASIFTAEVTAIDLALDTIAESDDDHFIIFSDSLSVLLSLHNKKMDNPLILQLLQKLHHLSCAHKTIHLCWIPSHIGIRGNEAADMAAKESLNQDITASQVPYTDLKSHINHFISSKWQERWSSCRDNKLFQIKPTLGEWPPGFRRSRKEEVVLSRLIIGHTYFSHSYILRREDPPECTACQEIYSVRHVLLDCIDYTATFL